jgi:hypothetical protein
MTYHPCVDKHISISFFISFLSSGGVHLFTLSLCLSVLHCRMTDYMMVFYDIVVHKQVTKRGKNGKTKKVLEGREEIAVGLVGNAIGEDKIWWAEHVHLRQQHGDYNMLHELGSKEPLIDPKPKTGKLLELPLCYFCEGQVPAEVLRLAKIKITQEQWEAAKAISQGQLLFFFFCVLSSRVFFLSLLNGSTYTQAPGQMNRKLLG